MTQACAEAAGAFAQELRAPATLQPLRLVAFHAHGYEIRQVNRWPQMHAAAISRDGRLQSAGGEY